MGEIWILLTPLGRLNWGWLSAFFFLLWFQGRSLSLSLFIGLHSSSTTPFCLSNLSALFFMSHLIHFSFSLRCFDVFCIFSPLRSFISETERRSLCLFLPSTFFYTQIFIFSCSFEVAYVSFKWVLLSYVQKSTALKGNISEQEGTTSSTRGSNAQVGWLSLEESSKGCLFHAVASVCGIVHVSFTMLACFRREKDLDSHKYWNFSFSLIVQGWSRIIERATQRNPTSWRCWATQSSSSNTEEGVATGLWSSP